MEKRALLALVVVAFAVGLAFSFGTGTSSADVPGLNAADWSHAGCWSRTSGGPCLDVYSDGNGNYLLCKACNTTNKPNPGKCDPISQLELSRGFWCS